MSFHISELLSLLRNTFSVHIMLMHHVIFVKNTNLWPSQRSAKNRIVLYHKDIYVTLEGGYYCMAIIHLLSLMTFIYFFKINIIKLTGIVFPPLFWFNISYKLNFKFNLKTDTYFEKLILFSCVPIWLRFQQACSV